MLPIINFKICDNSAACSGISDCPMGVFTFCETDKTIKIDNEKCTGCGGCEDYCPVGAIRFAKDDKAIAKIRKEIERDPRTITELFVDRYGADTVVDAFTSKPSPEAVKKQINSARPVIIEFNTEDTISCLLNSIPISLIQEKFHKDAAYARFFIDKKDLVNTA